MKETVEFDRQTRTTQKYYNLIALIYRWIQPFTRRAAVQAFRQELWSRLPPGQTLEVGVGTGKNMVYYPEAVRVTAIDLSERMLIKAREQAEELGINVDLRLMDVQSMSFQDNTFDSAVSIFVFCTVPSPVKGLKEIGRVVKPGGDIWLMEHVRIDKPVIGTLMDLANPFMVLMMRDHINRRTVENVKRAGLQIVSVENLRGNVLKRIHAKA